MLSQDEPKMQSYPSNHFENEACLAQSCLDAGKSDQNPKKKLRVVLSCISASLMPRIITSNSKTISTTSTFITSDVK